MSSLPHAAVVAHPGAARQIGRGPQEAERRDVTFQAGFTFSRWEAIMSQTQIRNLGALVPLVFGLACTGGVSTPADQLVPESSALSFATAERSAATHPGAANPTFAEHS